MRGQRGKWLAALIALTFLMTSVLLVPPVQAAPDDMIITGRLSDEHGASVVLYRVYLNLYDKEGNIGVTRSTETGWDGRYSFGPFNASSISRYRLGIINPAEDEWSYRYGFASPGTLTMDLTITIYGTTIINVINDEDETAVPPGVPVWITYGDPHPLSSTWPWDGPSYGGTPHHVTDSEGRISLYMKYNGNDYAYPAGRRVTGGIDQTYNMVDKNGIDRTSELRYEMGTQGVADVSTRAGKTRHVDFRVRGLGRIIAVARDAVTAAPIPEIIWGVSSDSEFYKYWQTSADSSTLSVYGYGNEDMIITADAAPNPRENCPGYQPAPATVKVERWGTKTVDLNLQPNSLAAISGKVLGPDGNSLPEARVSLIWVEGEWGEITLKELTADSSGNYTFQDVIPSADRGYYLVRATKAGYGKNELSILGPGSGEIVYMDDLAIGYDTADPCWSSEDEIKAMIGRTAVRLAWPGAWDDTGIKGYLVYRDGALLADVSATAYTAGDLETSTGYDFSVIAYDAAGKSSEPLAASVTTLPVYNPEEKVIRASVTSEGIEGNGYSSSPAVSADGRFIVFGSEADNLHEPDSNAWSSDIFLFDRDTGQLKCISTTPAGTTGNNFSCSPAISGDGRYIVFVSYADDLAAPDTNDEGDVFVYDRQTASLEIVSIGLDGKPAGCNGSRPSISADGNYIVFVSSAANLAAGDTNGKDDIFIWERSSKTIARLEHPSGMNSVRGISNAVISADGNYIACEIYDEQYRNYIYVYNRHSGAAELVSRKHADPAAPGYGRDPGISADGRKIVFASNDSTLVASDTNGKEDVFVYDRVDKEMQLVSVSTAGEQGNNPSNYPAISANGRFVAFKSCAANLAAGAAGAAGGYYNQVFVRDLAEGRTEIVSLAADGTPANGDSSSWSSPPALSADGRYVVFDSDADNLVLADQNNSCDIFSCDRGLTMTDAEKVAADQAALLWDCIRGNNTARDNVTTGLVLPGSGANGTIITWQADPAGWIDIPAGTVTRPAAAEGDQAVALTAAISKGAASDTVTFDLIIKAREAPPVLSETGASALASTTATLHFTSDKAGTYYCLVYEAAQTPPDAAAIKAQGEAAAKGSGPAAAAANSVELAGLTAATGYTAYLFVETDDGCSSAIAEIGFETAAAAPVTVTEITIKTPPAKVKYTAGDELDLGALEITLHRSDQSTEDVALADFERQGITTSPAHGSVLQAATTRVTITHQQSGTSIDLPLTVEAAEPAEPVEPDEPDEPLDECFIATAAFGSKLEPSVVLLRRCRDEWLLSNAPGRAFVDFYYAHSPALAAKVAAHAGIKYLVRLMLLPVIALAWAMLNFGAALPVLLAAAVCLCMIRRRNRKIV